MLKRGVALLQWGVGFCYGLSVVVGGLDRFGFT